MMSRNISSVALALALPLAMGCGGGVPEKTIEVDAANDPLNAPRQLLERYAAGQPLGSEVTGYEAMVKKVRESDPERAKILETGLEEIKNASAGARKAKAKELLAKLQPSMKGPGGESDDEAE